MNKAFIKENDDDNEPEKSEISTSGVKNYVTPFGHAQLQQELTHLLYTERPKVVETVRWAAGNGDRSENGDYIYGKKRLREIDRRIRYLTKRLEAAIIVDPSLQKHLTKVYFGAMVTYAKQDGHQITVQIVGIDEADLNAGKISWISPLAKALLKAEVGDQVILKTPEYSEKLEILTITY